MKKKLIGYYTGFALLLVMLFSSCHEDLSTLGSEVLGDQTPYGILSEGHSLKAYNQRMSGVQSNDLSAYRLGIYNDPTFGKSTSNFLTQILLKSNDPKFEEEAVVDSVIVYIPYFSKEVLQDTSMAYALDSVYGKDPINIKIFESGYFLRDYDPQTGFEKQQPYFSDQGNEFDNFIGQELGRVENFKPSEKEYVYNEGEDNEQRVAPGLRVALSKEFFQEKIINKEGSAELRNNNNFRDYFRGLYFKVESIGNGGNVFLFDRSKGNITIYYSYNDDNDDKKHKNLVLDFGGVSVNIFNNDPLPHGIANAISNPDKINGDQALYLRGGEGIMTVLELFGKDNDNNGVPDELELLRAKKWLINEANLVFYVNQDILISGTSEPERISIYNLRTNAVLMDYLVDPTNGLQPLNAFTQHLGRLERGSDKNGVYYKMRITNYISNLINKDSINSPLGIVVSQNVTDQNFKQLISPQEPVNKIPAGSVMSPKGTVLHGNTSPNQEKRLKLQIYYTEPN